MKKMLGTILAIVMVFSLFVPVTAYQATGDVVLEVEAFDASHLHSSAYASDGKMFWHWGFKPTGDETSYVITMPFTLTSAGDFQTAFAATASGGNSYKSTVTILIDGTEIGNSKAISTEKIMDIDANFALYRYSGSEISLDAGDHTVTISVNKTTDGYFKFAADYVSLTKIDESAPEGVQISNVPNVTIPFADYANKYVGNYKDKNGTAILGTSWGTTDEAYQLNIPIYAEEDGIYSIDYLVSEKPAGAWISEITVLLDGKELGKNSPTEGIEQYKTTDNVLELAMRKYTVADSVITAGNHTLTLSVALAPDSRVKFAADSVTFTKFKEPENTVRILNLSTEIKESVRLPFQFRDGLEGYASIEVQRYGEVSDNLCLMLAQYQGGKLVGVNLSYIDATQIADKETKTFRVPMTLKQEGYVKAFVLDGYSLKPLCEATSHTQLEEIFSAETVQELKEKEVTKELATSVVNSEGNYYSDYSQGNVKAIFYTGYNGTKVFAYMGIPDDASAENPVPAMVCVHGGGGAADPEWVKNWNDKGVAAISMDLYGKGPDRTPHPYRGTIENPFNFSKDFENAGMYQNVVNVMYANNLLCTESGIDKNKIGITGISWGGVTTTTAIGVDDRFLFAAPIYGCGYLDESRTDDFHASFHSSSTSIAWDPANFAVKTETPVLYVNSDVDDYFSINSTSNTAAVTKNSAIAILHDLGHTQQIGRSIKQVYDYGLAMFNGNTTPFVTVNNADILNRTLTADITIPENVTVSGATVYYITEEILPWNGYSTADFTWESVTGMVDGSVVTAELPDNATFAYLSVTDNENHVSSSGYLTVE